METLSAKDICEIISACKNSKVKKLTYGGLSILLGDRKKKKPAQDAIAPQPEIPKFLEELKSEISEQDRLTELMFSNPLQYEDELKKIEEA